MKIVSFIIPHTGHKYYRFDLQRVRCNEYDNNVMYTYGSYNYLIY